MTTQFSLPIMLSAVALLSNCASYKLGPVDVEPSGGAGFAGVRTPVLLQEPSIAVAPGCAGRCSGAVIADSVDLVANRHYEWHPALSTGVSFDHYAKSGVGGGVGLAIVLVPGKDGATAPWPAATVNLGSPAYGFFAGFVIMPTDAIAMPPGVTALRVQRDHVPDLSTQRTGRAANMIFGMRLGAKPSAIAASDTVRP